MDLDDLLERRVAVDADPGIATLCQTTRGDPHIRVAILDGGVDVTHPGLMGTALVFAPPATSATHHGTHIASIILGRAHGAVRGLAPGVTGVLIPIFEESLSGPLLPCTQQTLAAAMHTALDWGCHLINVSAGAPVATGRAEPSLAWAVRQCEAAGVLVIAAVGNHGCACPQVPAALSPVLAVGAMDEQGHPLPSNNLGA